MVKLLAVLLSAAAAVTAVSESPSGIKSTVEAAKATTTTRSVIYDTTASKSTTTPVLSAAGAEITSTKSPSSTTPTAPASTPTVTLDYSTIVPVYGNASLGYYKFQNIRFAAPPTGTLRFAAPTWPSVENSTNTGNYASSSVTCGSAEDCLFCDIYTPAKAFSSNMKFPVVQWYWGGGYASGGKTTNTPEGLFNVSQEFVWISCNHRLGVFGLANGPTFTHEGGSTNAAVRDVEHAFRWTKKYISAFGGNPNKITASGLSSGGSQVMSQMTRYAGHTDQLFNQAYIISPGLNPGGGHHQAEAFWQNLTSAVGCQSTDLSCMRNVPYATLGSASNQLVSQYGYVMQPRVDGDFMPDTPEAALYQNQFNFSGPVVITHQQHESNGSPWPGVNTEADIVTQLYLFFPGISSDAINQLLSLYPAANYASPGLQFADMQQSFHHTSKDLALTHALHNETWQGYMQIPPATHAMDYLYYFYTGDPSVNATIALTFQKYLLSFVITGNPNKMWHNTTGKVHWPKYGRYPKRGPVQLVVNTTLSGNPFKIKYGDDLDNAKTLFWNRALWY